MSVTALYQAQSAIGDQPERICVLTEPIPDETALLATLALSVFWVQLFTARRGGDVDSHLIKVSQRGTRMRGSVGYLVSQGLEIPRSAATA